MSALLMIKNSISNITTDYILAHGKHFLKKMFLSSLFNIEKMKTTIL